MFVFFNINYQLLLWKDDTFETKWKHKVFQVGKIRIGITMPSKRALANPRGIS